MKRACLTLAHWCALALAIVLGVIGIILFGVASLVMWPFGGIDGEDEAA